MTIICGTDFSENAAQAARAAASIARCTNDRLELVHVLADPAAAGIPALGMFLGPLQELLAEQAGKLAREFSIPVNPTVLEGPADERLVDFARSKQARLIAVSSLGARKQDHFRVGSVAERVLQRSDIPVLVVREAASIEQWAENKRPLRILLGADLGQSARAALRWVEVLRQIRPCDVHVVQVAWPMGEHARFGLKGPIELEGLRPELRALLDRDLRAWTGNVLGDGQVSFSVSPCWGRFDEHLAQLAQEEKADLVVVGTHQRAWTARVWQGSISRGVVHRSSCNVACVPRSAAPAAERAEIQRFRSVLIPTDFSPLANRAIAAGYGLLPDGGEVHLLHVLTRERADAPRDLDVRLRGLVPVGAEERGIETRTHVLDEAEPWSGIWHAAARFGVDAICMATHGRSGPSRLLLGSQAEEVVRRARQPVVLVKGDVE
ncbi:MAG TPA: universal stress protein [Polyangiaceae bacterium]|jgi:nucleotide-binding universal stress UspA family protein|nr:universal stress protein [Polyangiaceae bacterium]